MKLYFTFIISLLSFNLLFGQENHDSLFIKPHQNYYTNPIPEMNFFNPNLNEPLFVPEIGESWKKNIFPDIAFRPFKLLESVKKFPDGRLYLSYTSANQLFHYFTTSYPVSLQFDFHLKPFTGWQKLGIYFFGNSLLFNKYSFDGEKFIDLNTKAFFWETGAGIEYEYKEKKYLFYEFKTGFQNNSFLGKRNKAGVKFKF